jgi:signal transduction histidine kinase
MKRFDYVFGTKDEYMYSLWIEDPDSTVLKQMASILAASFVVLLLLGWLFYYLMHTIWKQKTLEEMKNDFINNMTHEFKTPLAVSYAAIDSLLVTEKINNKEYREKYLNIAKDRINHLSGLVEQILSMSKDSKRNIEMNPEKIELKEMVESIVRQQKLTVQKSVEFDIQIVPDNLTLNFDRMHLANILNNLIENSIKYSDESVKITLKLAYIEGKKVKISIEDNGIGIDSEKQKNVFDKFYRAPTGDRHNVKGYGLGLFYVKETLEQVGGTVSVKSKPGKGSVFTICIPQ